MSDTDSRWMTYRELAEELGISLRAAEARARRQVRAGRWHQRNHNDALKTAMVKVPRADLETMRKGTAGDTAPTTPGGAASVAQGGTVPDTYPQAIKAALDVLEAAHLRELDGVKASHERVLAARDELAGELRQRAEKAEMGQEAEQGPAPGARHTGRLDWGQESLNCHVRLLAMRTGALPSRPAARRRQLSVAVVSS
jgi:hypothetical protein